MHYANLIIIPGTGDPREHVARILEPFCEHVHDDGWWDFYQIGGRYSGAITGYDPETDPRNLERCNRCNGKGCNEQPIDFGGEKLKPSCVTGMRAKWPTLWADADSENIRPAADAIGKANRFYRIITELGDVFVVKHPDRKRADYHEKNGAKTVTHDEFDGILQRTSGMLVVVVDNHS